MHSPSTGIRMPKFRGFHRLQSVPPPEIIDNHIRLELIHKSNTSFKKKRNRISSTFLFFCNF
jgi:hypothetical protein